MAERPPQQDTDYRGRKVEPTSIGGNVWTTASLMESERETLRHCYMGCELEGGYLNCAARKWSCAHKFVVKVAGCVDNCCSCTVGGQSVGFGVNAALTVKHNFPGSSTAFSLASVHYASDFLFVSVKLKHNRIQYHRPF